MPAAQSLCSCKAYGAISGAQVLISRCGYTGEDGYEISIAEDKAEALAKALLAHDDVEAIGLGARDSLRWKRGYASMAMMLIPAQPRRLT